MAHSEIISMFPPEHTVPEQYLLDYPMEQREYLCDGEIRQWYGDLQDVVSPIHGAILDAEQQKFLGRYPLLTEKVALEVLESACNAYGNGRGLWPIMSIAERILCVETFTCKMVEQRQEVVKLLMWEIGKTLSDAEKEFDRTIDYIRDTIDALKDLDRTSSRFVFEAGIIGQIRRAPLGVVLCMGPFNYPLNETFTTLIPALIMGNTVVFKPPKLGVLLHKPLLQAFRDSFPNGVVNTVYGDGQEVVGPLMKSGRIDVLAFIGTSRVADILKNQHPKPHRLRCILGLEAKNAGIILSDADIENTVKECVLGSLSFNGQRCTALKVLFIHRNIADTFIDRFCAAVDKLQLGMPWDSETRITPLPEPNKSAYLNELIEDAVGKGAEIVNNNGGKAGHTLVAPTVVYPVSASMRLFSEEQFGPVVPIVPFDTMEEPMNYVADSAYGQQVSIFGNDHKEIAQLVDALVNQVCRVNINCQCQRGPDTFPFTGRKDSAEGTLSVTDALRAFSIRTLAAAKETTANKRILQSIVTERCSKFLSTDFIF